MSQDVHDVGPGAVTASRHERGLVQRVRRRFRQLQWPGGAEVLVGFSGGADSLALLTALSVLQRQGALRLCAIHVDHRLHQSSSGEAVVARGVAERLGVECVVVAVDPAKFAGHHGVGVEEAARRERYRLFADVLAERQSAGVALGHHQRDQAETVLLHLARGAGLNGAAGMSALTRIEVPWWSKGGAGYRSPRVIQVWRPLLDEPVEAVRGFASSLGLPIVDDPSNDDLALRRNAIRHEVLPALERAIPGATAGLARFAALAAEDDIELERQAIVVWDQCLVEGGLRRSALARLPIAVRRRVVRRWVLREAPASELPLDRVEALLRVAERPGGRRTVELGGSIAVVVEGDLLRIESAPVRLDQR